MYSRWFFSFLSFAWFLTWLKFENMMPWVSNSSPLFTISWRTLDIESIWLTTVCLITFLDYSSGVWIDKVFIWLNLLTVDLRFLELLFIKVSGLIKWLLVLWKVDLEAVDGRLNLILHFKDLPKPVSCVLKALEVKLLGDAAIRLMWDTLDSTSLLVS